MSPGLDHAQARVAEEIGDHFLQKIGLGKKIGVEYGREPAQVAASPSASAPALYPRGWTPDDLDLVALIPVVIDPGLHQPMVLPVNRQNLDDQPVFWVMKRADRVNHPLGDIQFVIEGSCTATRGHSLGASGWEQRRKRSRYSVEMINMHSIYKSR